MEKQTNEQRQWQHPPTNQPKNRQESDGLWRKNEEYTISKKLLQVRVELYGCYLYDAFMTLFIITVLFMCSVFVGSAYKDNSSCKIQHP